MTTRFRSVFAVTVAALALGVSTGAFAGSPLGAIEKGRERQEEKAQKSEESRESSAPPRQQSSSSAQREDRPRGGIAAAAREARGGNGSGAPQGSSRGNDRGNDRGNSNRPGGQSGGQSADNPRGNDSIVGFARRNMDSRNHGNGGGYNGGGHSNRPPRIVHRMPSGYRDYYWGGNRYYYSGGYWYRPYGSSFISIGAPYGLFVGTLPGYYSSFWYDDTRYFYADHTYYTYEPTRRGYVVARSPYGDDEEYDNEELGDDLYIYPARGQSEQQQADDRYECHRWAASEADYDPLDDEYDADLRKDYQRAMTACLTGRGYTVN
jgi:hypothetical protein